MRAMMPREMPYDGHQGEFVREGVVGVLAEALQIPPDIHIVRRSRSLDALTRRSAAKRSRELGFVH